jgi:hypothetical protein
MFQAIAPILQTWSKMIVRPKLRLTNYVNMKNSRSQYKNSKPWSTTPETRRKKNEKDLLL